MRFQIYYCINIYLAQAQRSTRVRRPFSCVSKLTPSALAFNGFHTKHTTLPKQYTYVRILYIGKYIIYTCMRTDGRRRRILEEPDTGGQPECVCVRRFIASETVVDLIWSNALRRTFARASPGAGAYSDTTLNKKKPTHKIRYAKRGRNECAAINDRGCSTARHPFARRPARYHSFDFRTSMQCNVIYAYLDKSQVMLHAMNTMQIRYKDQLHTIGGLCFRVTRRNLHSLFLLWGRIINARNTSL